MVGLAEAGSAALVGAMATEAWPATRSGVARMFGRGRPARQARIEAHLDSNAALVAQADDPDATRRSLVPVWRSELAGLLRRHPDAAAELRALLAQLGDTSPATQPSWTHIIPR